MQSKVPRPITIKAPFGQSFFEGIVLETGLGKGSKYDSGGIQSYYDSLLSRQRKFEEHPVFHLTVH